MATNNGTSPVEKSRAFLTQNRDEALKRFPELSKAYEVRDQLQNVVREAKPVNETVRLQVETTINRNVAASLSKGAEPQIRENTIDAVRFQVAYQSAEHVAGARRLDPSSTANITPEHRSILVNHAEKAIRIPGQSDAAEEHKIRARETAALVGLLDMPRSNNPFSATELKQSYAHQQSELIERAQQRQQNQVRDHDRGR